MDLFVSPSFSSHVKNLITKHHTPGLAIALVQDDTIHSTAYGYASLDPPEPCTPDTLFDIASASKSLTAAAVALLVEDHERFPEVRWEARMCDLLPEDFVMAGEGWTREVSVDDVLGHRTGMPSHDDSYMGVRAAKPDNARSVTRNLRNLPVTKGVREKFMYCNQMYTVATHLVEQKTGQTFPDFLEERFFRPLGMDSTNLQPERARSKGLGSRIALGHTWLKEKEEYIGFQAVESPEDQGAGSIMTSVNDYIKYIRAIMNQSPPFTETVYKGLLRPRTIQDPEGKDKMPFTSPVLYAAGWETVYYRGQEVVSHDGSVTGWGSTHFFLPGLGFGGCVFGNGDDAFLVAGVLMREFVDARIGVAEGERPDWDGILSGQEEDGDGDEEKRLRQEMCHGIEEEQAQELPLENYVGEYHNAGYHSYVVQVKDGELFIDATDRSFACTMVFEHVCGQTNYLVRLRDFLDGGEDLVKAAFRLEDGRAVSMGLGLEDEMEELIWFESV
ncbi:hypothetical protein LTR10_002899 [Elasticomyces elasticus]|nr:hypothetical protein LTR10_002899 [Elasticomyces elasticus]KAK4967761.1 hypothetical protein LTR42_010088 [Elasticomyces elasticus]